MLVIQVILSQQVTICCIQQSSETIIATVHTGLGLHSLQHLLTYRASDMLAHSSDMTACWGKNLLNDLLMVA